MNTRGIRAPRGADALRPRPPTPAAQQRLLLVAMRREQRAREAVAQVEATLERQREALRPGGTAGSGPSDGVDQEDVDRLVDIHGQLDELVRRRRRFSRRSADKAVLGLEFAQQLVLGRLGFATYEDYESWQVQVSQPASTVIDLAYLEYARCELESAEWLLDAIRRGDFTEIDLDDLQSDPDELEAALQAFERSTVLEAWAGPPPPLPRRKPLLQPADGEA